MMMVFDVRVKGMLRVDFNSQIGDRCRKGNVLVRESDTGDGGRAELVRCVN